jgi:hypothetical protein
MKRSRGVVTMAAAAVVLLAGVVLGLMPVTAQITQLQPELRLLSAACGNGYLQTTPQVRAGNLVELPDEPGVYLPKDSYAQQCSSTVGWRKYAAWGLTVLGVLALAFTFARNAAPKSPVEPEPARRGGSRRASDAGRATAPRQRAAGRADGDTDDPDARDPDGDDPAAAGSGGAHRRRQG